MTLSTSKRNYLDLVIFSLIEIIELSRLITIQVQRLVPMKLFGGINKADLLDETRL
jgi:hypothetical protein